MVPLSVTRPMSVTPPPRSSDFDELVDRHGLEKIKTIGDAYLVAGGVRIPRPDHAIAVACSSATRRAGSSTLVPPLSVYRGTKLLLLPTTCTVAKVTCASDQSVFSTNVAKSEMSDWVSTSFFAPPRVRPGFGKNKLRIAPRRSSGSYPPLFARWQSVHSLSPGV